MQKVYYTTELAPHGIVCGPHIVSYTVVSGDLVSIVFTPMNRPDDQMQTLLPIVDARNLCALVARWNAVYSAATGNFGGASVEKVAVSALRDLLGVGASHSGHPNRAQSHSKSQQRSLVKNYCSSVTRHISRHCPELGDHELLFSAAARTESWGRLRTNLRGEYSISAIVQILVNAELPTNSSTGLTPTSPLPHSPNELPTPTHSYFDIEPSIFSDFEEPIMA